MNKLYKKTTLWSVLTAVFAVLALFFGGLMAGNAASFAPLYKNSEKFRSFAYRIADNVTVQIEDGKAVANVNGTDNATIDTFTRESDFAVYAMNGYNLIVDTRDEATAYNDFTLTYVSDGKEYSAEEWRKLGETEKKNYSVKINYSSESLKFTEENTSAYVAWMLGDECTDKEVKARCRDLLDDDGNLPESNYNAAYELYVSAYYSDLSKVERYGKAPTMRSYYMNTYLATDKNGNMKYKNFVVILQNIYFCYFTTDSGVTVSMNGYFNDVADISVNSAEEFDKLLSSMYDASTKIVSVNYFLYIMRVAMFALIAWLATALIVSICGWIGKCAALKEYGSAFKSFATFWLFSGLVAAISAFVGSFFLSRTVNFWLAAALFIGLSVVRCIEQNVYVFVKHKKETKEIAPKEE